MNSPEKPVSQVIPRIARGIVPTTAIAHATAPLKTKRFMRSFIDTP